MKKSCLLIYLAAVGVVSMSRLVATAQVSINAGTYSQNFDALGSVAASWTNNVTLPGWYASKGLGDTTNYFAGSGSNTTGGMYSFGANGVGAIAERALGAVAASSVAYAFGVRLLNDTSLAQTNITLSYTGEEWRSGSTTNPQTLEFTYQISSVPFTNSSSGTWTVFSALSFVSPNLSGSTAALDGNAATNRQTFNQVLLTGVTVLPGQELFVRWRDVDDTGFDNGLAIDDLTLSFNTVTTPTAPSITTQPQSQTVTQGDNVTFTAYATGNPAPSYQWQFNGSNLAGATDAALLLLDVTTNQAGSYIVSITNTSGTTNSQAATLTVNTTAPPSGVAGFSLLTFNVKGNGATDWSTNAAQIGAIARQLQYLQPDIITFNEIPYDLRYEMTNFVATFLPGYSLALSSGTDGSICSAIASRFAIARATSWLGRADLRAFGYSNANNSLDNFTRDLYEAQIPVPGFPQPLHVFTTHLKSSSSGYTDAAAKRAAEAAAITNWFATSFFVLYPNDPYTLSGDMNEGDPNTLAIQRLVSPLMGLHQTNPTNPFTGSINTYTSTTPSGRIDYLFPSHLLFSNLATSQVFRTGKLNPVPPNLNGNDDQVASDHLPVLMVFNNPYDKPFQLTAITRSNPTVALTWESVFGQPYRVESSSNLTTWTVLASNLVAADATITYTTNLPEAQRYFRVYRVP